jgi:hypothetical protein
VIEAKAADADRANLLAVTEILAGLVYDERMLRAILRGGEEMIESPVLQRWFLEREVSQLHDLILKKLGGRFAPVPEDVSAAVRVTQDKSRLEALLDAAYTCTDLDAFRLALAPPAA